MKSTSSINKIAAVTMVKNEEDFVETFVRHTCLFVDVLFICDHMSSDHTVEILQKLQSEGLPIKIFTYEKNEFALAEVLNSLMQLAFDSGADIILPLDTDEILITTDGNTETLRKKLQTLDPNFSYRSFLWNHKFAAQDNDTEKFALSRNVLCEDAKNNEVPKMIIGRNMIQKYDLIISQGNHRLNHKDGNPVSKDDPIFSEILRAPVENIFHAHFMERSIEQVFSKYMISWLNTKLKHTKYTSFARYAGSIVQKHFSGEEFFKLDLTNYVVANHLLPYKDEAVNQYSNYKTDPLKNLYQLADKLVDDFNQQKILQSNEIVRTLIFFDGDDDKYQKSLESVQNQTYPFIEIIKVDSKTDLEQILKTATGSYVQFVLSGDILYKDKIMHCVEFMHSDLNPSVVFTNLSPIEQNMTYFPTEIEIPFFEFDPIFALHGYNFLNRLSKTESTLISGLSRGFFKQELFNNVNLKNWIRSIKSINSIDATTIFFLSAVTVNSIIYFMNENLVTRGTKNWTTDELNLHKFYCKIISEGVFDE